MIDTSFREYLVKRYKIWRHKLKEAERANDVFRVAQCAKVLNEIRSCYQLENGFSGKGDRAAVIRDIIARV
jgi:hypothetical protein